MNLWSRSHSLQRKIITAIVLVGLLPLTLLLAITYVEERRALRDMTGVNFKEAAVEAAHAQLLALLPPEALARA